MNIETGWGKGAASFKIRENGEEEKKFFKAAHEKRTAASISPGIQ